MGTLQNSGFPRQNVPTEANVAYRQCPFDPREVQDGESFVLQPRAVAHLAGEARSVVLRIPGRDLDLFPPVAGVVAGSGGPLPAVSADLQLGRTRLGETGPGLRPDPFPKRVRRFGHRGRRFRRHPCLRGPQTPRRRGAGT